MNRGQDRRGFDDRGGFDDFGNFPYAPGEIRTQDVSAPPEGVMDTMEDFKNDPRITGSTNDILKSLVGLGADPNNTAQRTMQDAMNAQKNQQTSSNTMLDGSRPPQPPMQPPFNPYQKFNYGGGRGGYKNDRRFGGRLPDNYTRMPEMRIPEDVGFPSNGINRSNV